MEADLLLAILRNLSVILLCLEALVFLVVPLVVTGALVYGLFWLLRKLPLWFIKVRYYFALVAHYIHVAMRYVVLPFFAVETMAARIAAWTRGVSRLLGLKRRPQLGGPRVYPKLGS